MRSPRGYPTSIASASQKLMRPRSYPKNVASALLELMRRPRCYPTSVASVSPELMRPLLLVIQQKWLLLHRSYRDILLLPKKCCFCFTDRLLRGYPTSVASRSLDLMRPPSVFPTNVVSTSLEIKGLVRGY